MLKMLQRLALILMVLIAAGGCGEESPGSPLEQARVVPYDSQAPLRIFLTDLAEHYQLPAIAAAIVHPDGRIETAMVGQNRAVGGAPLASDSVFHIGSCGKSITALLAATFVEQGALSWDTSVNDVFPEIDRASSRVRAGVSLRELLSHTAGIEPFTSDQDVFGADSELAAFSGPLEEARRSFALWLLAQPLFGEVGEFHYSNAGYAIVAAMLEEVSGKPFEQLVQERIFGPLGLESAIVGFAVYSDPGEPWRHLERDVRGVGVPLARNERQYPAVLNPAGNISMSIDDLATYVAFHADGLRGNSELVSPETMAALHNPVVTIAAGEQYALGWYIREIYGVSVSTHSGSDQTIFALISINRSSGASAAVATNIGGPRAEMAVVNAVLELLH